MKRAIRTLTIFTLAFGLPGCSEPGEAILAPQDAVQVHAPGWLNSSSSDFHGVALAASGYNLISCQQCHGDNFQGGLANVDCLPCHNSPDGPKSCNTCHGDIQADPADLLSAVPPRVARSSTRTAVQAEGAHLAHLAGAANAAANCLECHQVPSVARVQAHISADGRGDVQFRGVLANFATENGNRIPGADYLTETQSCNNTYCHGNWGLRREDSEFKFIYTAALMEGTRSEPIWTDPASASCGSCHALPPVGHVDYPITDCVNCHDSVIDASGQISNHAKHADGNVNVFRRSYPMF